MSDLFLLVRGFLVTAVVVALMAAGGSEPFACGADEPAKTTKSDMRPRADEIEIRWTHLGNLDTGRGHRARWRLTNRGQSRLPAKGWAIYFCQLTLADNVKRIPSPSGLEIEWLNGDFFRFGPSKTFAGLAPGESAELEYEGKHFIIKESWAPEGMYVVFDRPDGAEGKPEPITRLIVDPFTRPEQMNRGKEDRVPVPTPAYRYSQNKELSLLPAGEIGPITPTPVRMERGTGSVSIDGSTVIHYEEPLKRDAEYLAEMLKGVLGTAPKTKPGADGGANTIVVKLGPVQVAGEDKKTGNEAYTLSVEPQRGITIVGADAAGAFYGIQSLLQLIPPDSFSGKKQKVSVPAVKIGDAPRFGYRGQHLDVSHHFHTQESVLRLLDRMAFYKLNKLHLHLSDNEGWRIEIPSFPELTELFSRRGHTLTNDDFLHPSYGSGPDPDHSYGSGFYSHVQYLEILRRARDRHIDVIPEIDMPAHFRAGIYAMKHRERKLRAAGKPDEAVKFQLHDPEDTSKYFAAQAFDDDVVCVANESVYRFVDIVFRGIAEMYKEAGVPLVMMHIGGDEVASGAWSGSPRCKKLMEEHPEIKLVSDLHSHFTRRIKKMLEEQGLKSGVWQETTLRKLSDERRAKEVVDPQFADGSMAVYIWNNLPPHEDLCNQFANAGYPVVLCSVSNLYFDLAYDKDPLETGLAWGGFVGPRQAFELIPEDVKKSSQFANLGRSLADRRSGRPYEPLTEKGAKNVLGIQGQIWCETIKGPVMLDYYSFPKIIALAERAWGAQPAWAKIEDDAGRQKALDTAWNEFANRLGQREFPRLDWIFGGTAYRLPPPGAVVENGKLLANVEAPGLTIRYTTDGSEPNAQSPAYREPVAVSGKVRLRSFDGKGRGGRIIDAN